MPAHQLCEPATASAVTASLRPTADFIALSSDELMVARKIGFDPKADALAEGDFWTECMEGEDDCMTARRVVPFDTFPLPVWHTVAANMFAEPCDERDASQIDRLVERRGLFPHDHAKGSRQVALPAIELLIALESDVGAGSRRSVDTPMRIRTLNRLSGMEPDFYTDPDALSARGWDALSVTIFEKTCTARTGTPVEIVFDRPDLTTGTPLAHARAHLYELQAALCEIAPDQRGDAAFNAYVSRIAESLLAMPELLDSIYNDRTGAFGTVADFLDVHHPEWSDGIAKDQWFNPLLPVPCDWNGHVDIVGLIQDHHARMSAEALGVAPQLFGLYAGRHDGSTVWLGAAACEADAHKLVNALA